MNGRAWTNVEQAELRRMYEGGFPLSVIANKLDRSVEATKHKMMSLGLRRIPGATDYLSEITLLGEEWRCSIVYGYFVSSLGRVISTLYIKPGSILKPWIDRRGYHHVVLSDGEKSKRYLVHQLVALAFLPPPLPGYEICHNDGNPSRNCVSNLRWDTHRSNVEDRNKHGTMLRGEKHQNAKCTELQAQIVKEAFVLRETIPKAAELANVSYHIAADIKKNRTWRMI